MNDLMMEMEVLETFLHGNSDGNELYILFGIKPDEAVNRWVEIQKLLRSE